MCVFAACASSSRGRVAHLTNISNSDLRPSDLLKHLPRLIEPQTRRRVRPIVRLVSIEILEDREDRVDYYHEREGEEDCGEAHCVGDHGDALHGRYEEEIDVGHLLARVEGLEKGGEP